MQLKSGKEKRKNIYLKIEDLFEGVQALGQDILLCHRDRPRQCQKGILNLKKDLIRHTGMFFILTKKNLLEDGPGWLIY